MHAPFSHLATVLSPLTAIKLFHTAVWALLAGCIVALPIPALLRRFKCAWILTAIILAECAILALNRGRCPLTDLAAHYTPDRSPNFDIYLPTWLAAHNKAIFGALFVFNELIVSLCWCRHAPLASRGHVTGFTDRSRPQ